MPKNLQDFTAFAFFYILRFIDIQQVGILKLWMNTCHRIISILASRTWKTQGNLLITYILMPCIYIYIYGMHSNYKEQMLFTNFHHHNSTKWLEGEKRQLLNCIQVLVSQHDEIFMMITQCFWNIKLLQKCLQPRLLMTFMRRPNFSNINCILFTISSQNLLPQLHLLTISLYLKVWLTIHKRSLLQTFYNMKTTP